MLWDKWSDRATQLRSASCHEAGRLQAIKVPAVLTQTLKEITKVPKVGSEDQFMEVNTLREHLRNTVRQYQGDPDVRAKDNKEVFTSKKSQNSKKRDWTARNRRVQAVMLLAIIPKLKKEKAEQAILRSDISFPPQRNPNLPVPPKQPVPEQPIIFTAEELNLIRDKILD